MNLSPRPALPSVAEAEFDAYADGYDAGMGNPVKRLVGSSPADFLRVKVRWLMNDLRGRSNVDLIDYGCGPGGLLAELAAAGFPGRLAGCDVSEKMLALARKKWDAPSEADFFPATAEEIDERAGRFDVAVISAVLHHVMPPDRPAVYAALAGLLKPGGRLYVFEHNPRNPVTVWVVKNTPIDQNAVLASAGEVKRGLAASGFVGLRSRYLMFFPPRMTWLRPVERLLTRVPLGGQFAVRGERGA